MPEQSPTPTPTPPAPTPSSPPPSGTPTSTPAEFRFGNDPSVPEYARGKTAQEVLGITQRLVANLSQVQAPAPTPTPQAGAIAPDDFVTGQQFTAAVERFTPDVNAGVELAASAVYGMVRNQYAKEFAKYGPEIAARLAPVPKKLWTLDNLETVVKLVRADHFADYQAEWETEARARLEPTIRSNGAGGSAPVNQENKEHSLESEKIPAEWKLRAQKAGITESTVREFCASNSMSEAEFYKQFDTPSNAIVAEVQSGR